MHCFGSLLMNVGNPKISEHDDCPSFQQRQTKFPSTFLYAHIANIIVKGLYIFDVKCVQQAIFFYTPRKFINTYIYRDYRKHQLNLCFSLYVYSRKLCVIMKWVVIHNFDMHIAHIGTKL